MSYVSFKHVEVEVRGITEGGDIYVLQRSVLPVPQEEKSHDYGVMTAAEVLARQDRFRKYKLSAEPPEKEKPRVRVKAGRGVEGGFAVNGLHERYLRETFGTPKGHASVLADEAAPIPEKVWKDLASPMHQPVDGGEKDAGEEY